MKWEISSLNIGDHIRVKRSFYYHHGIYVGDNLVIHYTSLNDDGINDSNSVEVRKTTLDFFSKDSLVEVAKLNKIEEKNKRSIDEILSLSNKAIGTKNYDFYKNNCEDFVNSILYKKDINTQLKKNNKENIFISITYFIIRVFIKFTGLFAYILYLKPRFLYESDKAKYEFKHRKDGAILAGNHTSIFDYYAIVFKLLFHKIHTLVADVVYKIKGLRFLNNVFENIEVRRDGKANIEAINKAKQYLLNKKTILIFPEGKLEDSKGKLEELHNTATYLSISLNKKLIPIYFDGNYKFFHRPMVVIGEPLNLDDIDENDSNKANDIFTNKIDALKDICIANKKIKAKRLFTFKYWVLDFLRLTSIPLFYLVFITKKIYVGNKKDIKAAIKYNCILASNHLGPCDCLFPYLHFLSRRIRVMANESLWNAKPLRYMFDNGGVIKYAITSKNSVDYTNFKEMIDTLVARGCLSIYPEGHFNKNDILLNNSIHPGVAALSLLTNSPIIPYFYKNEYKYFKKNVIVIGQPIYPSNYYNNLTDISADIIIDYKNKIYEVLKDLSNYGK